jgi:gluconokinase
MSMAASRLRFEMSVGPIIVMGVSGCGKTTAGEALARHFSVPYIEGDALHPAANVAKMASGAPLNDEDRWPWLEKIGAALKLCPGGAVATCSSLKHIYRERLRETSGGGLRFVFLKCSKEVLEERMRVRKGHFMPPSLLASQLATLEDPGGEAGVVTVNGDAALGEIMSEIISGLGSKESARQS